MKRLFFFIAGLILTVGSLQAEEDLFTLYGRVQEAWKQKDYVTVLALSEQLLSKAPGHSGVQFQYARALAANNRTQEALKVLTTVARMGGSPPARDDEAFSKIKEHPEFQSVLSAFEKNRATSGNSTVAFTIPGKDLIPEGIAYDPIEKNFYIGSTYRRKILQVSATGVMSEFAGEKENGLWGMIGMEVDPVRRHLWANSANTGANTPMIDPEHATEGKTAIFKFDLKSRKMIRKYETGTRENARFFNDIAIASNGDVYISESTAGEIYRIRAEKDELELFAPASGMEFPNGIAISQDGGWLYVAHFAGITVIDLASGTKRHLTGPADSQLGGHDGLIYYKNSLIGIQALTGGVDRIVRFHLRNPQDVERVEVLQVNHPLFALPTTGDMAGDEFHYIANSQLRSFDEKGVIFPAETLNAPVILKIDLLESEKEELRGLHEKDRQAHLKTDARLLLQNAPAEFVAVSGGKINRVKRDAERKMFENYFQGALYSIYEDLEPPIIHVSKDGRSGWVITRLRAERTQNGKVQKFVYAGIMTYEKNEDHWVRVANVSTFEQ